MYSQISMVGIGEWSKRNYQLLKNKKYNEIYLF